MTNINEKVWRYIDKHIEIQKTLSRGLINTSALAREIARQLDLSDNIDAIISAIRRYEQKEEQHQKQESIAEIFKKAQISSNTKLVSILLNRTDEIETIVGDLHSKLKLKRESTLRIFTVINHINIVADSELLDQITSMFTKSQIVSVTPHLCEIIINYKEDLTQIAGVFGSVYNELAMNSISVIDSMISHWEHVIVIAEKDLEKSFNVIFQLTKE